MPFERCEKNHFMNEHNTQEIATQYSMKPDHWKDREIFSSILPPNTAVTSFHHVHHRRGQFSKPGCRTAVFVTPYTYFPASQIYEGCDKNIIYKQKDEIYEQIKFLGKAVREIISSTYWGPEVKKTDSFGV